VKTIYQVLAGLEIRGEEGVLCTVVSAQGSTPRSAGAKMVVFPDSQTVGTIGGGEMESLVIKEALEALEENLPRTLEYAMSEPKRGDPGVCGGTVQIYIEPITPAPTLAVAGAGHVGKAVVFLANWLGFRVVITDDREEFCTPEKIPLADAYYPIQLADLPKHLKINRQTYLVLTTRNVMIDVAGLPALLESGASYIGIIGSRRRWATTRKHLVEQGIAEEILDRVISPMGLEINAETPEEIAVSILAEIIMLRNGGDGTQMGKP